MPAKKIPLDKSILEELYITQKKTRKEICEILGVKCSLLDARIKEFGLNKNNRFTFNHNAFSKINPESSYWAGFLAADGWISSKSNLIGLELCATDDEHLKKFCRFIGRQEILDYRERKSCFNYGKPYFRLASVKITNKKIKEDLDKNFNIIPKKTFIIKPPVIDSIFWPHFIRGYVDGDGSIGFRKSSKKIRFHVCSASKDLVDWMAIALGDYCGESLTILTINNLHTIATSGKKALKIFNKLYENSGAETRLDRKYERYLDYAERNIYNPNKIEINKDQFYKLYVVEKNTAEEVAEKLGKSDRRITQDFISRKAGDYKISKREQRKPGFFKVDHNAFSAKTEKSAFWAGFLSTQIWPDKWPGTARVELVGQKQLLKQFCNFLNREPAIFIIRRSWKDYDFVNFKSEQILKDLCEYGVKPGPPRKIGQPDLPLEQALAFISGHMLFRGSIGDELITVSSVSEDFLFWAKDVFEQFLSANIGLPRFRTNRKTKTLILTGKRTSALQEKLINKQNLLIF